MFYKTVKAMNGILNSDQVYPCCSTAAEFQLFHLSCMFYVSNVPFSNYYLTTLSEVTELKSARDDHYEQDRINFNSIFYKNYSSLVPHGMNK